MLPGPEMILRAYNNVHNVDGQTSSPVALYKDIIIFSIQKNVGLQVLISWKRERLNFLFRNSGQTGSLFPKQPSDVEYNEK